MVDRFLADSSALMLSNELLAKSVEDMYGSKVPSSLLTEKLSAWQKGKVQETLNSRGIVLERSQMETVSKIKKALLARTSSKEASFQFSGTIIFTPNAIVVNGKQRLIQNRKVRSIHVGRLWLNVEALKEWLS